MEPLTQRYKTARAFRIAVTARLKGLSRENGEPHIELYRRIAIDRFLARIDWSKWTAKGGYILQRRLPQARATKDIDLATSDTEFALGDIATQQSTLVAAFQEMVRTNANDYFVFQVMPEKPLSGFGKGGIRCNIRCLLDGEIFATFQLDAIIQDEVVFETESIEGDSFFSFVGLKPLALRVPIQEEVFAEKIHAYTLPRERENTRVKDLLDLALLLQNGLDREKVKEAIVGVFAIREQPFELPEPPESWGGVLRELVKDSGIDLTVENAFQRVVEFYRTLNL